MKTNKTFIYLILLSLISCDVFDDYMSDGGVYVYLYNESSIDIEWVNFYIGKYDNNIFYPTDSIIRKISIQKDSVIKLHKSEKGWLPNKKKLDSGTGSFFIKLSDGRSHYFGKFTQPKLEGKVLNISIFDDKIYPPTN